MRYRWLLLLLVPRLAMAQVRYRPDPRPAPNPDGQLAAARILQRASSPIRPGMVSQFDSLGLSPMAAPGDSVTIFLFPDGESLRRVVYAQVAARRRFDPPAAWRAQCDDVAHSGWIYDLKPAASASYALAMPGVLPMPRTRSAPVVAVEGARPFFLAYADTVWQRYRDKSQLESERAVASARLSFFSPRDDAGYDRLHQFGVVGPNGFRYSVFSFWLHDDSRDGAENTTGTWIVNAWGYPVARASGNVDIYGTIDADHDGIDEIVTSSGLIRWNGTEWKFPTVYSEEPCLLRSVLDKKG